VKAIIYEKKLEDFKPSHILSKIMSHELQLMPKSKNASQEKPKNHPLQLQAMLSSQQEKVLSRMTTHGRSSEDNGSRASTDAYRSTSCHCGFTWSSGPCGPCEVAAVGELEEVTWVWQTRME
jgi:hypothetical protein